MTRARILQTVCTLASLLMFAACTQDELAGDSNTLPEGKYPLEIGSVSLAAEVDEQPWRAGAPQTRVAENTDGNSSHWEDGDKIHVMVTGGGINEEIVCTLDANGKVTNYDKQLYWKNATSATFTAWYATDQGGTVNLSDQSSKLAYVLTCSGNGGYDTPITLNFTHALAKVRVIPSGSDAYKVNDIQIKTYTSCTHTKGEVSGSNEDWIKMKNYTYNGEKRWEANVVPGKTITEFQVNGVSGSLITSVSPEAGKWHEVKITAGMPEMQPGQDGNYTVNEGDNVFIDGKGIERTASINIKGTATVTLRNVKLKNGTKNTYSPIKIEKGTATIIIEGENTITGTNHWDAGAGIHLVDENSNVIIQGAEESHLTVNAFFGRAAIGSKNDSKCGSITIKDATIIASTQNNTPNGGGAAIGSGSAYAGSNSCGLITIINSDITASAEDNGYGNSAVIGTGGCYEPGCSNSCEGISITLMEGQSKENFLAKLSGTIKVGAGAHTDGTTSCGAIHWYNANGTEI